MRGLLKAIVFSAIVACVANGVKIVDGRFNYLVQR